MHKCSSAEKSSCLNDETEQMIKSSSEGDPDMNVLSEKGNHP